MKVLAASFLLIFTLLSAACGGHGEPADSSPTARPIRARLAIVEANEIADEVEIRGVVEADTSIAISTRVSAMVTRVAVKAGERVRPRQVLIEIDPDTARGQLAQATGALAQARAALALAERNLARFQALAASDAASALELDMAQMQFEQAKGAVEQAEGAVRAARSVASESTVRAPFAGLVVRRLAEVGDLAAPGKPLLLLESEGGRRLVLPVPESVAVRSNLAIGAEIRVALDTRPDLGVFAAPIVERSSGADPVSHSFDFEVELPAQDIASGTAGRAWIPTGTRRAVLAPRSALLPVGGMTMVVLRGAEGTTESRVVTVGRDVEEDRVEILSGLSGGEEALVGLDFVPRNGSPVEVEP